jgi:hypothetical protein
LAKRLLTRLIYLVIGLQTLLWLVDGFPFWLSVFTIASHITYLGNMRRFPAVKLTDPLFLVSCCKLRPRAPARVEMLTKLPVLVLVNHYLWFSHFSTLPVPRQKSVYDKPDVPGFTEIASYFGICVWLVPFALFVSLSAGDNVLPTMGSEEPTSSSAIPRSKRQGMVKVVVDTVLEWIGEMGKLAGWSRPERGF